MTEIPVDLAQRRAALSRLFVLNDWADVKACTEVFSQVSHTVVRGPQTGLIMVRGRMGATGSPFNFGEATVTRCSVRIENDIHGHAYAMGRNTDLARRMAICDAVLQTAQADQHAFDDIIKTLADKLAARRKAAAAKVAATKVDFFTVVRGDD